MLIHRPPSVSPPASASVAVIPPDPHQSPAKAKLEALIERGRASAALVVEEIYQNQPHDFLVKGNAANFALTDEGNPCLLLKNPAGEVDLAPIHPHAIGQVADKFDIPKSYIDRLRAGKGYERQLLIHNLNQLAQHDTGRYLVRVAHREVRGFLSDKYRRMDSRPILEAFVRAVKTAGAEPYNGVLTDTSFSLKAILPVVHEPVPGEALAFGVDLASSDYGSRALSVSLFVVRIRCANLAVFSEDLRKVHLGARLGDDAVYSRKTYELDTRTIASAIADIVKRNFLPERIETINGLIRTAAVEQVTPAQLTGWLKKNLTKAESEAVSNAFNSPDIEMLPPGQNRWRFAQALSFVAGRQEDGERQLEIERAAGRFLSVAA